MEQETRTDGDGSRGKQKLRKKKEQDNNPSLSLSLPGSSVRTGEISFARDLVATRKAEKFHCISIGVR